jgi:hypothetical protein
MATNDYAGVYIDTTGHVARIVVPSGRRVIIDTTGPKARIVYVED